MHFTPTARLRLTHRLPQLEGFAAPAPIIYNHSHKKTAPSLGEEAGLWPFMVPKT